MERNKTKVAVASVNFKQYKDHVKNFPDPKIEYVYIFNNTRVSGTRFDSVHVLPGYYHNANVHLAFEQILVKQPNIKVEKYQL